jgi:uncharacterized repeat protein (TIGR03833 family)
MIPNQQDGRIRINIHIGSYVEIVQKHHQRTGELTEGIIKRILTKSPNHPHGIKVMLESGEVGRVKRVISD